LLQISYITYFLDWGQIVPVRDSEQILFTAHSLWLGIK